MKRLYNQFWAKNQ